MKIKLLSFLLLVFSFSLNAQEVWITGYIDSSCPQAKGRTVEIYVSGTVNLSAWNLVRQSNGNGYTSNISIGALGTLTNEYAYITNDEDILTSEFDLGNAAIIQSGAINDNGDDAFQLVDQFGNIIDRFGEEGVQPDNNSPWYHKKTYYYRKNGGSPNQGNFDPNNWTFGSIDLLIGEGLCNGGQAYQELVPFGSFDPFACEPVSSLPFIENFENSLPPSIHNCSSLQNEGNDNNWFTAEINQNGFSGKVLKYDADDQAANAWYFTRGIELNADTEYQLEFRYGNNDPLSVEKLKVGIDNQAEFSSMEILETFENINSGSARTARIYFSPSESGIYHFGFMAFSDANQNELYLDDITVDFKSDCSAPINASLENLSFDAADLIWEDDSNTSWKVTYFPVEEESEVQELTEEEVPSANLENLMEGTAYQVHIQSLCSDNGESEVLEFTFSTLCGNNSLPYLFDFEEAEIPELPECLSLENGSAGNFWETADYDLNGFDGKVLRYQANENNPARAWVFTNGFELQAGELYQISYVYGNDDANKTEKMKLAYGNSPTAASMEVDLADHNDIHSAQAVAGEHIFEVEEDGTYYFGFLAYSDANQGNLYLDDIKIDFAPSCLRPTDLQVDNSTADSADLSWTDANQATSFEIIYGLYGFDPQTEGENLSIEGASFTTLENLQMGTTYEVYVKTQCSDTDESQLSFPIQFTTDCEYENIPYIMDFEQAIVPQLPNCSVGINEGNGNEWISFDDNSIFQSKVLKYDAHFLHSANAWFFTNGLHLEANTNYQVTYSFANSTENTNFFEKLKVAVGDSPNADSMNILFNHPHISGGQVQTRTVVFSVDSDGVYFIGFNAYSNFNASSLYLDDIEVDLGPSCPQPADLYYTNLTHESVDMGWVSSGNTQSWELVYGLQGFDPDGNEGESILVQETPEAHLSDLQGSTNYDVYVRSACSENESSAWEGPKYFRTKITPPDNNWLCNAVELEVNQVCEGGIYTNIGAFSEPNEPSACFDYPGKTVWFRFVAPSEGEVTLSADFINPNIVSEIVVFEAPSDCEDMESLGVEIACAGYGSHLFIPDLNPGTTYYVQVAANSNKDGNFCIEASTELSMDSFLFQDFVFYPNPVENQLSLKAGFPIEKIDLYNLAGKRVKEISPDQMEVLLPTEDLNSGLYLMEVEIQGVKRNFKLIRK